MASSPDYLKRVLEQLSGLGEEVTSRNMMGEYLLYYRGRLFGGIYDDRLMLKPLEPALNLLEHPVYQLPYPGAKAMLLMDEIDDADLLCQLVQALYPVLPKPRKKSKTLL